MKAVAEAVRQPKLPVGAAIWVLPSTGSVRIAAPTGSFGWRTASATAFIPAGATAGTINLGLQSSSGTVWVRSVKITASEPAATVPEGFRAVYTDRVKRMPRLRGVMSRTPSSRRTWTN
ncbi:MAG: hypothetical protein V8T86_08460 [Victivallis sp.]